MGNGMAELRNLITMETLICLNNNYLIVGLGFEINPSTKKQSHLWKKEESNATPRYYIEKKTKQTQKKQQN